MMQHFDADTSYSKSDTTDFAHVYKGLSMPDS